MSSAPTGNDNQAQTSTLSEHQPKEQGSSACVATMDPKTCLTCCGDKKLINLPCGHSWCPDCISAYCSLVVTKVHWPLRCGEQCWVPEDLAMKALPQEQLKSFEAKLKEFETPERKRCYCANTQCNKFIAPDLINDKDNLARCGECSKATCTLCRREQHQGPCAAPSEEEMQAFDLMASEGYQQCTECHRVVERTHGCPHMTCYCGHEFCYHCGSQIQVCNGCVHKEPEFADLVGSGLLMADDFMDDITLPGLENPYVRILDVLATRTADAEPDIHPHDHVGHLEHALGTILATNIHTATPSKTILLNMVMNTQGYEGPVIYFDAHRHAVWGDPAQTISSTMELVSDVALWQAFMAMSETSETHEEQTMETMEAEFDRIHAENLQEQREAREAQESWAGDWDM